MQGALLLWNSFLSRIRPALLPPLASTQHCSYSAATPALKPAAVDDGVQDVGLERQSQDWSDYQRWAKTVEHIVLAHAIQDEIQKDTSD